MPTSSRRRPASSARRRRRRARAARTLAVLGSGAQIVAVFLPWDATGRSALDLGLRSLGERADQPTVALVLVALAAVAVVPALVRDTTTPPLVAGAGGAAIGLAWIVAGPAGDVPTGAVVALGASAVLLLAGATARRARAVATPAGGPDPDGTRTAAPGFELRDHTADTAFAAWGPTRASCFAQAVRALVASFAEFDGDGTLREHPVELQPATDEDLLVDLLSEVLYLLDARRELPVGGALRDRRDGGIAGTLDVVPLGGVRQVGAVPKAITYHGLEVERGADGGWRCQVTIDV